MPCSLDEYEVISTIGSGSYGTCKKIRRKKDGRVLVWKELDYGSMSETEKQMLVSEVNLLRELKHQHIVRYYDRIIDRSTTTLYIIMEYCEGGDLSSYISKLKKEGKTSEEEFVWKICYQVVSALKECHCRNKNGKAVLHRDLKPANIFLDEQNNVKLGDFGLARVLNHETSFAKTFVGTPYYMSPEQMNYMSYNEKSDVWSLGCMLYELCALRPPFTASNQRELASRICTGHFHRLPMRYSDDLNELISFMLKVEEYKRPTIDKLLDHPVLQKHCAQEKQADKRSSVNSEDGLNSKMEALKQKEEKLQELERQQKSREKKIADKEKEMTERDKNMTDKERQLNDKERQLQLKEQELENREKSIVLREKVTDDRLARVEKLLESPRPKLESTRRPSSRTSSTDLSRDHGDHEPGEIPRLDLTDSDTSSVLSDTNPMHRPLSSCLLKNKSPVEIPKKKVSFSVDKENLLYRPLSFGQPASKLYDSGSSASSDRSYKAHNDVSSIQKQLELEHHRHLLDLRQNPHFLNKDHEKMSRDIQKGLRSLHMSPAQLSAKYNSRSAWRY